MKRFFCTICGDVKRVRVLPQAVGILPTSEGHVYTSADPATRLGECRWHASGKTHRQFLGRIHRAKGLGSTRRVGAKSAKSKSKKG